MEVSLKADYTSVGWCVTENGLIKRQKKDLIGAVLFDKATINENRRNCRKLRRNKSRKKDRIKFLTNVFEKELNKKDPEFLKRVQQSGLMEDDKTVEFPQLIEKENAKEFPKMFHLRSRLIREGEDDVRLLYLALLHMFKARGNFLLKGDIDPENISSFDATYAQLREVVKDRIALPKNKANDMADILRSNQNIQKKTKSLMALFEIPKENKDIAELFKLMLGGKADLKKIFPVQLDSMDDCKLTFDCEDAEGVISPYEAVLEPEEIKLLTTANAVYAWTVLDSMLKGEKYISDVYVRESQEHSKDRNILQNIIKKAEKEGLIENGTYEDMFLLSESDGPIINNYKSYTGKMKGKKGYQTCSEKDFYLYVSKKLNKIVENMDNDAVTLSKENESFLRENIQNCLDKMSINKFLPKPRTRRNFYVPNQLIKAEMKQILEKSSIYHPFLVKIDEETGLTIAEELLQIFSWKIPYWVGPIDHSKYAWCVFRDDKDTKIYPWNIYSKIDLIETRKAFMKTIVGECNYLYDKKVLPDSSYYNRKLLCLNEVTRIRIDGEKLSLEAKHLIWNELFLKHEKVTERGVISLLEEHNYIPYLETGHETSGFVKRKLVHTMSPFLKAKAVYPDIKIEDYEKIAEYITVCKGDRELLFNSLEVELSLSKEAITNLVAVIKDSGWSEYSYEFLCEVKGVSKATGEMYESILDAIYKEGESILSILSDDYTFMENVNEHNKKVGGSHPRKIIEKIKNPVIRREMYRLYETAVDIKKYLKKEPEKVFLNVFAIDTVENKKVFQKTQILSLLKKTKEKELLDMAMKEKYPLPKKRYLYYMQKGKCLYSGEKIPYESISGKEFTIEHILPKSKIYNNSNNNLCLVKNDFNEEKSNYFPISEKIQEKMHDFWNELYSEGFITEGKYELLNYKYGIPAEQKLLTVKTLLEENRKNQMLAKMIIQNIWKNAEIIFVKDECLNQIKSVLDMNYSTTVNSVIKPASEAFLMSVAGNVWRDVFTDNPRKFILESKDYSLNIYNYDSKYWNTRETPNIIEQQIDKAHILQSVMNTRKTSGSLYDISLLSSEYIEQSKSRCVGRKGLYKDAKKYGGYTSIKGRNYVLFKSNGILYIASISLLDYGTKDTASILNDMGYEDVEILRDNIPTKATMIMDGQKYYINSISQSIIPGCANPIFLKTEDMRYFTKVETACQQFKKYGNISKTLSEEITKEKNKLLFYRFFEKYLLLYKHRANAQHDVVGEIAKKMDALSLQKQCELLCNIWSLTSYKQTTADLSMVGLGKNFGKVSLNRNLDKHESFILIDESITGLFSKQTQYI